MNEVFCLTLMPVSIFNNERLYILVLSHKRFIQGTHSLNTVLCFLHEALDKNSDASADLNVKPSRINGLISPLNLFTKSLALTLPISYLQFNKPMIHRLNNWHKRWLLSTGVRVNYDAYHLRYAHKYKRRSFQGTSSLVQ